MDFSGFTSACPNGTVRFGPGPGDPGRAGPIRICKKFLARVFTYSTGRDTRRLPVCGPAEMSPVRPGFHSPARNGRLAQQDRALVSGTKGPGFEPQIARHERRGQPFSAGPFFVGPERTSHGFDVRSRSGHARVRPPLSGPLHTESRIRLDRGSPVTPGAGAAVRAADLDRSDRNSEIRGSRAQQIIRTGASPTRPASRP